MKPSLLVLSAAMALGAGLLSPPQASAQATFDANAIQHQNTGAILKTVEKNSLEVPDRQDPIIRENDRSDEPAITVEDGGVNRGDPASLPPNE